MQKFIIVTIIYISCIHVSMAQANSALLNDSTTQIPSDSLARNSDPTANIDTLKNESNKTDEIAEENSNDNDQSISSTPDIGNYISGYKIFWTLVFLIIGYVILRTVEVVLNIFAERSTKYRIAFKGAIPIIKIIGWVVIISLIVVIIYNPPASTILAFSASIGVAVGFASQDLLKNIFGGIIILIDRPFKAGDKIEVGGFYGEVTEIGLRSTRIITADDSLVSIPNSSIMNSSVSNANSGEPNCQVVAEIYLPVDTDTIKVRSIATRAARISKYVYLNKPITVLFFNEIKEKKSYLKMRLKAYVRDIRDEFAFKSDMTELVLRELNEQELINKDDQ